MTLCPIALMMSCERCFVVSFCPLKGVVGDYRRESREGENGESPPEDGEAADEAEADSDGSA